MPRRPRKPKPRPPQASKRGRREAKHERAKGLEKVAGRHGESV